MILTRSLITKFIPEFWTISDESFTDACNALGMEVESINKYKKVENCIVGKILDITSHNNAHSLNVCKVKVGNNKINTIVCGAKNLQLGKYVIVALEGAKLPDGRTIEYKEVRGILSQGMMCSYSELTNCNLYVPTRQKDEIIMLDDAIIGDLEWEKYIGLNDTIYDVSAPANRNDLNSYLIFCLELAAKLNLKYDFNLKVDTEKLLISYKNEYKNKFDSLNFMYYENYHEEFSDWIMQSLLMNHQIIPVNKLIDTLSYITLLTNCPMHVYDATKINGKLNCKQAESNFEVLALNGKTYEVLEKDLIIIDENKCVGIASVIGNDETKLVSSTQNYIIEIGNFNYVNVRETALRLNINTDASKRSSKPFSSFLSMLAVQLVKKFVGQPIDSKICNAINWNEKAIAYDEKLAEIFLNNKIKITIVKKYLTKFGFKFDGNKIYAPQWRLDIYNNQDIFEEILKEIDINKLPTEKIVDSLLPITPNFEFETIQKIKKLLIENYFSEVLTYNLVSEEKFKRFNVFEKTKAIKIISNNTNRQLLRNNLIDAFLEIYKYNQSYRVDLLPIFEIQKLYPLNEKPINNLTIMSQNFYAIDSLSNSKIELNINFYKSIFDLVSVLLNTKFTYESCFNEYFYDNECLSINYENKIIGFIGKIKKSKLKFYDLDSSNIYCATLNLPNKLLENIKKQKFVLKPISSNQQIFRDININVKKSENINKFLKLFDQVDIIEKFNVIKTFEKNDETIYTIRYHLNDNRVYSSVEIEQINILITKLIESNK